MLAAFFGNTKLILGSVATFTLSIFYFVFKQRGRELEQAIKEKNELERDRQIHKAIKVVDEEVHAKYKKEEAKIDEEYEEEIKELYKEVDAPLPMSFLKRLHKHQGLSNNSTNSPE